MIDVLRRVLAPLRRRPPTPTPAPAPVTKRAYGTGAYGSGSFGV